MVDDEAGTGYLFDLLRKLGLSEFGARTAEFLLVRPLKIAVILLLAVVVARVGGRAVRRGVVSLRSRPPLSGVPRARSQQRATTLGDVLAGGLRVVVLSIAGLIVLDELGINLAPLIAGAGIAGVAVGFGAQSLVKDVISGLFILLEDQYGVGDVVTLGEASGTVEDVTLRVTRLRGVEGTVWFVPNGEIRRVGNSSMEWSRALIDVLVAYGSDIDEVRRVLGEVASTFADHPSWAPMVLEPPDVWGVQAMEEKGIRVRLVVKTAPRSQWIVARELRTRLVAGLSEAGVRGPGAGDSVVVSAGALDAGTPPDVPVPVA